MKLQNCENAIVKNITVSVDDETHRQARIRAAEMGTSVSALVRGYLIGIADGSITAILTQHDSNPKGGGRRMQSLMDVIDEIRVKHPDFRASDSLTREQLYLQSRTRTDVQ